MSYELPLKHGLGIVKPLFPTETNIDILSGRLRCSPLLLLLRIMPTGDLNLVVNIGRLAIIVVVSEVHVEFGLHLGIVVVGPSTSGGLGVIIGENARLQFEYFMGTVISS